MLLFEIRSIGTNRRVMCQFLGTEVHGRMAYQRFSGFSSSWEYQNFEDSACTYSKKILSTSNFGDQLSPQTNRQTAPRRGVFVASASQQRLGRGVYRWQHHCWMAGLSQQRLHTEWAKRLGKKKLPGLLEKKTCVFFFFFDLTWDLWNWVKELWAKSIDLCLWDPVAVTSPKAESKTETRNVMVSPWFDPIQSRSAPAAQ